MRRLRIKIANKELSEGCKVFKGLFFDDEKIYEYYDDEGFNSGIIEIIGHPVMIGDFIDYSEKKELDKIYNYIGISREEVFDIVYKNTKDIFKKIFKLWQNKRLPIEDQSDECIDFVYSLIYK